MLEKRMPYRQYKMHYADCETIKGSYDPITKSIMVLIPDGRMKKSGVRGEHFCCYEIWGTEIDSGRRFYTTVKAVCFENALKRLKKNWKGVVWDETY